MKRFRRLRSSEAMRELTAETRISPKELIYPMFVVFGENKKIPVESMPGIYQYSVDRLPEIMDRVREKGDSRRAAFRDTRA